MMEYLYYGMVLVALVLIYFGIRQYNSSKELINTGVKTAGKVVNLIKHRSEDGYTYKPVFEYTNKANKKIKFVSEISYGSAPYKIGEDVNIVYSKDGTKSKVVSFWGLYRWTLILFSIASPLLIIGGGFFLYSRA